MVQLHLQSRPRTSQIAVNPKKLPLPVEWQEWQIRADLRQIHNLCDEDRSIELEASGGETGPIL